MVRAWLREPLRGAATQRPSRAVGEWVRAADIGVLQAYPADTCDGRERPRMRRRLKVLHVVHKLDSGGLQRLVGVIVRVIVSDRFVSHVLTLIDFGVFAYGLSMSSEVHPVITHTPP